MVISQNVCWLALSTQDVQIRMKTKHPIHTMMFGAVTSNGDVILPLIFSHGLRLNTEAYIKCLRR